MRATRRKRAKPPKKIPRSQTQVALRSVLCTDKLYSRPRRAPDYEIENRALVALRQALNDSPDTVLQALVDAILEVVEADSAGVSLLAKDGKSFRWPAIAGEWKAHAGGGTPRDFSPCGDVLDRSAALMFNHPERRYAYLATAKPLIEECLLVPFYANGKAIGTIWAIAHDGRRKFDAEDLRRLVSLGGFASSAYQASAAQDDIGSLKNEVKSELRESEERYRNLFNSMDEGFCVIEMIFDERKRPVNYRFVEVNPSFERQVGLHDVVGKLVLDLVPDLEKFWIETYAKVALTGEPVQFSSEVKGLNRWLDIHAARLGGPENRNVAVLFTNITDRKLDEARILQMNLDLDRTVQERTQALMLLNQELESFCYSVSHDLRAPLRGITSFSQIIQRRFGPALDPEARRLFERIEHSGRRMSRIIDGLLSLSRLTRGNVTLGQIDISAIARSLGQEMLKDGPARKVDFKIETGLVALGDEALLRIIFQNLLENAFKFTQGTERSVVAVGRTPEGAYFVRDNGAGFDPDFSNKLFLPFQRLHSESEFPGDGIGLATVHRAVQRLGGRVWAESKLGQGATFYFELAA